MLLWDASTHIILKFKPRDRMVRLQGSCLSNYCRNAYNWNVWFTTEKEIIQADVIIMSKSMRAPNSEVACCDYLEILIKT